MSIDEVSYRRMRGEIAARIAADNSLLDQLRSDIRLLAAQVRRVKPQSATSLSLVATDGGNNQLRFDPFLVQLVRVVDSNDEELCLEAVSPTTPIAELDARHLTDRGEPKTPLGRMMVALGVEALPKLSPMARPDEHGLPRSGSFVQVYRELMEWAILYDLLRKDYASDTLVVFDGDLRSKVFAGDLFKRLGTKIEDEIGRHRQRRRAVFLVGLMKSSSVLARYRLAMALEGVLRGRYPSYLPVPSNIEERVYRWAENARNRGREQEGREEAKFVLGSLFFVKFGSRPADPIWPVHVFEPQVEQVDRIFGHLLADAIGGFPVPLYPRCLQKAHERAALVDFDMDILQDAVFDGIREALGSDAGQLDAFRLQDPDPAQGRYR